MKFNKKITNSITYIGVNDENIDLFENQYAVPNGISYNSYLIKDEKNVIMDTVDKSMTEEWMENLEKELEGEKLDYIVISHLEPDHSGCIEEIIKKFPEIKLVGNKQTFSMLTQFYDIDSLDERKVEVTEGQTLSVGKNTLQFFMAPMVHWPEVMVTYEMNNKILFSADAFGKFGAIGTDEDWLCEARRYYFNIVGKYGIQVQMLLKKITNLKINKICPLHGPILEDNIDEYINKYDIWSKYIPEDNGILIVCASIHGNTLEAAYKLSEILKEIGAKKVIVSDLSRSDISEVIEDAFRYDKLVCMASSYNTKVFTPMQNLLQQLEGKNYQKRKVAIIENGSWAPSAAKTMKETIAKMKDIELIEPEITIKSRMNENTIEQMKNLAKNILNA